RPAAPAAAPQRFCHPEPNDLWQLDFKGHLPLLAATGRCHPLTALDDHSRFALGLRACADEQTATVQAALTALFQAYGLPRRILCDNGPPWGTAGAPTPWTPLWVWLMRLGVAVSHGRAAHPQTQGKDERFHRSLKAEALAQPLQDLAQAQVRFDAWRQVYNHERPHEALGLAVPATHYHPSARPFPAGLPAITYDPSCAVRRVQPRGEILWQGQAYHLSRAFVGLPVGIRPTDVDGCFAVSFLDHWLVTLDSRTHTVYPVHRPSVVNQVPEHL
ncbi:MAG TPA: integrase core domain-containing protein, partial [Ktedonobacterales bacterium]|nr:integrase core domain-containing protein [Ktedonobacterales bacterium]